MDVKDADGKVVTWGFENAGNNKEFRDPGRAKRP
jgi:hypothetical protein